MSALTDVLALGDMELYGRCLLETQAYEHDGWNEYAIQEYAYFASSGDDAMDERWLRRLELFQSVVRDASAVAEHTHRTPTHIVSLDQMFSELVAENRKTLVSIFRAYADRDPVAALRLAYICNVDLVKDGPGDVIRACESSSFLAMAMSIAGEGGERFQLWSQVLIGAALERRLVSFALLSAPATLSMRNLAAHVNDRKRWNGVGVVTGWRGSYYEACLAATLSYPEWPEQSAHDDQASPYLAGIGVLRGIRPPSRLLTRGATVAALYCTAGLSLVALTLRFSSGLPQTKFFAALVPAAYVVLLVLMLAALHGCASIMPTYRRLLNVATEPARGISIPPVTATLALVGAGELLWADYSLRRIRRNIVSSPGPTATVPSARAASPPSRLLEASDALPPREE